MGNLALQLWKFVHFAKFETSRVRSKTRSRYHVRVICYALSLSSSALDTGALQSSIKGKADELLRIRTKASGVDPKRPERTRISRATVHVRKLAPNSSEIALNAQNQTVVEPNPNLFETPCTHPCARLPLLQPLVEVLLQIDHIGARRRGAGDILHPQLVVLCPLPRRQDGIQDVLRLGHSRLGILLLLLLLTLAASGGADEDGRVVLHQRGLHLAVPI